MAMRIRYQGALADLKGKSYIRQIWAIAWPTSISMLLFSMFDLIDLKWIGFLGTEPVAAASLVGNIVATVFGLMGILYTGAIALSTRFLGADDSKSLRETHHQAIFLGIVIGLCLLILGEVFAHQILGFFKLAPGVYNLALPYFRIFCFSFFVLFLEIPFWAIWTAKGKTRLLLWVNVLAVGLNLILDPIVIFPRGKMLVGFFGWGVMGAAGASLFAETFTLFLLLLLIRRKDFPVKKPVLKSFKVSVQTCVRILRIGVPSSVAFLSRPLSTMLLQRFITPFGASALAGFGIGMRWTGLIWIFLQGLSTAISSLVGRYLGAKRPEQAEAMMRRAFLLGIAFQFAISAGFFIFAGQLVHVMEPHPETVLAGSSFLKWLALAMLIGSPGDISRAALNGAGDTDPGMVASIIAHWIVKLPLAWILAFPLKLGIAGIWQANAIAFMLEGLILISWYSRGKWKQHKI